MIIVIANAIDFVAAFIQVGSGSIKSKTKILIVQIVQLMMQALSMLLLGGLTGAVSYGLACYRNYLCCKEKLSTAWKCVLSGVMLVMTLLLNDQGAWGYMPVVVSTLYIFLMDIKDPAKFKLLVTLSYIPWMCYHYILKSYVGALVDAATVLSNGLTFCLMIRQTAKKTQ